MHRCTRNGVWGMGYRWGMGYKWGMGYVAQVDAEWGVGYGGWPPNQWVRM